MNEHLYLSNISLGRVGLPLTCPLNLILNLFLHWFTSLDNLEFWDEADF
jgi:hypothetical protein